MKTFFRLGLLALSISLVFSCTKEEDSDGNPTLSTFLSGNFSVTRADYNGSVSNSFGNIPTSGTGTETDGFFLFEPFTKTTTYLLSTKMEVSSGDSTKQYPIYFGGAGSFELIGENSITINDAVSGSRTYSITERTATGLKLSTGYDADTVGGNANLSLSIYLSKD